MNVNEYDNCILDNRSSTIILNGNFILLILHLHIYQRRDKQILMNISLFVNEICILLLNNHE